MDHPIRRPDVQELIEQYTADVLKASGGTGRVLVEFDFKEWRPISCRPVAGSGRRMELTPKRRGLTDTGG
jgi:hypothetical protein